ncbi:MAG: hypothetical protein J6S96_00795 [Muribaculaceae bacterium]|nr:hypothetical protein [Muribaculaceae bacterium]
MKKLLSLLALLLPLVVHALPFVTTTSPETYPIHWYQLKTNGLYVYCTSNYWNALAVSTSASTSDEYLWCFISLPSDTIVIYNKAQMAYMKSGDELAWDTDDDFINFVEEDSGNDFYICYRDLMRQWYLDYDECYGFASSAIKVHTFTAIEALVEEMPVTDPPTIDCELFDFHCVVTATGNGEVHLYTNGNEVDNPYTVYRTKEDQQISFTATAQEEGKEMSESYITFTIPKLEKPGLVPVDVTLSPYDFHIPTNYLNNNGSEGYRKLFDKDKNTKWCVVNNSGAWQTIWVDFTSDKPIIPESYVLTTGNDTQYYSGRNPKAWKIYGKSNENDDWTTLVNVTDGPSEGLGTSNSTDYTFAIDNINTPYKYFRFEVSEINGINIGDNNYTFQLAEFQFNAKPYQRGDMDGSGIIDVEDVNAMINIILKFKNISDYPGNGDMDGNSIIDVEDVNALINIILKLE